MQYRDLINVEKKNSQQLFLNLGLFQKDIKYNHPLYVIPSENKQELDETLDKYIQDQLIENAKHNYLYMQGYTLEVTDEEFDNSIITDIRKFKYSDVTLNAVNDLLFQTGESTHNFPDKLLTDKAYFKLTSKRYDFYFTINKQIDNTGIQEMYIIFIDHNEATCLTQLIQINHNTKDIYQSTVIGVSTKLTLLENCVKKFVNSSHLDKVLLMLVYKLMENFTKTMQEDSDKATESLRIFTHKESEIKFFRKMFTVDYTTSDTNYPFKTIKNIVLDENIIFDYDKSDILKMYNKLKERETPIPELYLSKRDWNYIDKYYTENIMPREYFNLREILENPRYGDTFKWCLPDININFIATFELYDKYAVVHIFKDADNKEYTMFGTIILDNLNIFSIENSIKNIFIGVKFRQSPNGNLPTTLEDLEQGAMGLLISDSLLVYVLSRFITLLTVIHDRPNRMKIVNEKSINKKSFNNKKYNSKEKDFIVKRILMNAKDAKEYVKNKNEEEGAKVKREFIYVVESWEREGHMRELKNGKIIYIKGTTCTRKASNTDKEIRLKL